MELGVDIGEGVSVLGLVPAGLHVRLPPTATVRDRPQRAISLPRGLADGLAGAAGHRRGRARRHQRRAPVPVPGHDERDDEEERGVPRHVGVVPGHDSQPLAGGVDAAVPKKSWPSTRMHAPGSVDEVLSATTVCRGRRSPSTRCCSRTARTHAPSGVAARPPWRCSSSEGGSGDSGRGGEAPRGGPPTATRAGRTGRRRRRHPRLHLTPGTPLPRRTRGHGSGC